MYPADSARDRPHASKQDVASSGPFHGPRGLSVQAKLLIAVTAAFVTVLALTGATISVLLNSIDQAAQLEARNLATSVAIGAADKSAAVQSYVERLDELYRRDLFILDRNRNTIADILPQELGEVYRNDAGGQVEQTMRDGVPRTFIEVSAQHPEGAKQLVVPLHRTAAASSPIVGAVVLEYTNIELQLFNANVWGLYAIGIAGVMASVSVGWFGYRITRRVSRGLSQVHQSVLAYASGDTSVRISPLDPDEVGDLTLAFNTMADDLDRGRMDLQLEMEMAKLATQQAEYLAYTDLLTGLANRTQLSKLITQTLAEAEQQGHGVGFLLMDLDRFKNVNDTLGHEAGNEVLREVAERLRQCLNPRKHIARLGGDEFIVVVPNVDAPAWLGGVARKILTAIAQPIYVDGQELLMTCSLGISVLPRDGREEHALMKNADIALYQAKDDGRNGYAFYSPELNTHSVEKLAFESELRRALEQGHLTLHYQPKVEASSGIVTGVEALARWQHATMGSISPGKFIPVAEETGLIVPLGLWVLGEACRQQVAWRQAGLPELTMAVNLSGRQFGDPGLLDSIRSVLSETGIQPSHLELEITESVLMRNESSGIGLLYELKRLGLRIAVDDFGTGYSSLANLKRFPIDTLKIDRAFVRDLEGNEEDQAITRAIISMGKSLGLHIVAEGAETQAQCAFLRDHHCDDIQGFYFSKPVPADELARLIGTSSGVLTGTPEIHEHSSFGTGNAVF